MIVNFYISLLKGNKIKLHKRAYFKYKDRTWVIDFQEKIICDNKIKFYDEDIYLNVYKPKYHVVWNIDDIYVEELVDIRDKVILEMKLKLLLYDNRTKSK